MFKVSAVKIVIYLSIIKILSKVCILSLGNYFISLLLVVEGSISSLVNL